jgi:hypothetical protein
MNKYIKTFFTFIGVWFVASLLNGILSGICIMIFENDEFNGSAGVVVLACVFSFICSVPLIGMVWLSTTIAMANGKNGYALFQIILATAFFCALFGVVFFINTFGTEFKQSRYAAGLCIIISAIAGVLSFRNQLKTNE